jgi:hypothetical protein
MKWPPKLLHAQVPSGSLRIFAHPEPLATLLMPFDVLRGCADV